MTKSEEVESWQITLISGACPLNYSDNTLQLHIYEIKALMSNLYQIFI
ncbi:hypothetical protein FILTAD_03055 [Filibacter tadaridae]|uniref:Uncharacterized protein n=1 Tax=Filibacter tadaridae TaxID=2483811 RepID=A0A3P5XG99_9BACL|nr:hypothetical protein FILTAD_03055 [Filibacter tadaridae]